MLLVPELHVQNHYLTKIPQFQMRKQGSRVGKGPVQGHTVGLKQGKA